MNDFFRKIKQKILDQKEGNGLMLRRRYVKLNKTKSTKKLTKYLISTNLKCRLRLRNDKTLEKQFKEESIIFPEKNPNLKKILFP